MYRKWIIEFQTEATPHSEKLLIIALTYSIIITLILIMLLAYKMLSNNDRATTREPEYQKEKPALTEHQPLESFYSGPGWNWPQTNWPQERLDGRTPLMEVPNINDPLRDMKVRGTVTREDENNQQDIAQPQQEEYYKRPRYLGNRKRLEENDNEPGYIPMKRSLSNRLLTITTLMLLLSCSSAGLKEDMLKRYEENNDEKSLEDKQVIINIRQGEDMRLPCSLREHFNDEIEWRTESNVSLPRKATQKNGLLIFKDMIFGFPNVSCFLKTQPQTKQVYHILVIGRNETRKSPYGAMPRDLEAFNCEGDKLELLKRTSLVNTQSCELSKFRVYKDNRTKNFTLIHRQTSKESTVRTCKITFTLRAGRCNSGYLEGFIPLKKGSHELSEEECITAHKVGYVTTKIEHEEIRIGYVKPGRLYSQRNFLFGSGISDKDGSCRPCIPKSNITQYIITNKFMKGIYALKENNLATMEITVMLDEEVGVTNYLDNTTSIPHLGVSLKLNETLAGTMFTLPTGRLYVQEEKLDKEGWRMITKEKRMQFFENTSSGNKSNYPDVATLNINDTTIVAFQLYEEKFMPEIQTHCRDTQFRNIVACKPTLKLPPDLSVLKGVDSQSVILMQLNIDRSIAQSLQQLCQTRATLFRVTNQDPKQVAEATLKSAEGVVAMMRGEEFLAFKCAKVNVQPSLDTFEFCTEELPVAYNNKRYYISPISRILVQEPTVIKCSTHFPVKHMTSQHEAICQVGQNRPLEACRASDNYDPAALLIRAKLKVLTKKESVIPRASLLSDLQEIVLQYLLTVSYHLSLSSTIAVNSRLCKGAASCPYTYYTGSALRKELGKQTLEGLVEQLMGTDIYRMVEMMVVAWGGYCILTGLFSFAMRSRNLCSTRLRKYGITNVIMSMLADLESALVPVSIVKSKFKISLNNTLEQIDSLNHNLGQTVEQLNILFKKHQNLSHRLRKLEQLYGTSESTQEHTNLYRARRTRASIYSSGGGIFSARQKIPTQTNIAREEQNSSEEIYENIDPKLTSLVLNAKMNWNPLPDNEGDETDGSAEEVDLMELSSTSGPEDPSLSNLATRVKPLTGQPIPPPRHV